MLSIYFVNVFTQSLDGTVLRSFYTADSPPIFSEKKFATACQSQKYTPFKVDRPNTKAGSPKREFLYAMVENLLFSAGFKIEVQHRLS